MTVNQYYIITKAQELARQANELVNSMTVMLSEQANNANGGVDPLVFAITTFTLACFVGYYVVWKVTPALHTPLMSITNAISGIIILGAMLASSTAEFSVASVLGYFAVFLASVNIFGGFIVTGRMLNMFQKKAIDK